MQDLIEADQHNYDRLTVNAIINKVEISHRTLFSILTKNPGLNKLSTHWVPKALHNKDKQILSFNF